MQEDMRVVGFNVLGGLVAVDRGQRSSPERKMHQIAVSHTQIIRLICAFVTSHLCGAHFICF